ncbi:MAG TPA: hypothetical protein VLT91_15070 [Rhizomicrobium sp.]|nr:hypothetical protein [Rhizomicrobium sp.]
MNVYVLAMACVLHGSCTHGYFMVEHPALVSCERDLLPMVEGHTIKDRNGTTIVWHAESCLQSKNPPQGRQMMGLF